MESVCSQALPQALPSASWSGVRIWSLFCPFAPRDPPDSPLPSLVTGQRATVFAMRWTSHGPAGERLHRLKGDLEAFDEMVMGFKEIGD